MKKVLLGLVGLMLFVSCGNTTPPSPAGTWEDTNVTNPCTNSQTYRFTFKVSEPTSTGNVDVIVTSKGNGSDPEATLNLTGTYGSGTMILPKEDLTLLIRGTFDFTNKRFNGTITYRCVSNTPIVNLTFSAIKK